MKDGEIYGIEKSTNGRNCEQHTCCGDHISPNDLVRFKLSVVTIGERPESAIKAVHVRDGTELCTIGFLPQFEVHRSGSKVGKFAQIIDLYHESENIYEKQKSERNHGIASYRLLEDIQEQV